LKVRTQNASRDTLALTSKLLELNPEYYTIWNHRRRILLHLFKEQEVELQLARDLQFLFPLLIQFPKCYWIWNHRLWLLRQASECLPPPKAHAFWQQELGLVGKMLSRDSRNFHGWGYRRIVVEQLRGFKDDEVTKDDETTPKAGKGNPLTESEFAYTTKMINTNLSNFSAWHNRSKLIPQLLDERKASAAERRAMFNAEMSLVQDAVFTDPYDQSLWFYHQHLMSVLLATGPATGDVFVAFSNHDRLVYLEIQISAIKELLEDTDDCKWIYQSLLHYSEQYIQIEGGNKFITTSEMSAWLERLKKLDPLRLGRWEDFERRLSL